MRNYTPSGRFDVWSVVAILAACIPAAACAAGQRLATVRAGRFTVAGIGLLMLVGGCGLCAYAAVRWGRCRNPLLAGLAGFIVAGATLGAAHGTLYARDPAAAGVPVWRWLADRAAGGVPLLRWNRQPIVINGTEVWGLWATEALALFAVAGGGAWWAVHLPFCERCRRHATRGRAGVVIPDPTPEYIERVRKTEDVAEILDPETGPPQRPRIELRLELARCDCGALSVLNAERTRLTPRKRKAPDRETDEIRQRLLLSPDEIEAFELLVREREAMDALGRGDA